MDNLHHLLAATHLMAGCHDPETGEPFLLAFTPEHPQGHTPVVTGALREIWPPRTPGNKETTC